ncbi:hypothetical protein F5X68DRAFT_226745 [Plectosphaerella plurivora]|uniref:Peptidase S8/S53 domain-containing protein n=1 Tax=Plectosphaerella plurivora TaxID=936078 RepID=A0A9P9ADB5_9PEZI|nr:hypothetical protein F5X68DRAFT_226745 [Plectosphaerella plurivora]
MAPLPQGSPVACDIDDLHRLLCDVLHPFDVLSEHILGGCDEAVSNSPLLESDTLFYQKFRTQAYILRDALGRRRDLTRWGEKNDISEEDILHHLLLALDELESRFLSRRRLILSWGWANPSGISAESYPKLRVLQKSLHVSGLMGSSLPDKIALEKIINVVQIASKDPVKRQKTLNGLTQAADFFSDPAFINPDSHEDCPLRFEDYPYRHVREVASSTYDVLVQKWSCRTRLGCTIRSHAVPSVQLSLTAYRGFGLTPPPGKRKTSVPQTNFRLLFPTGRAPVAWQNSKISVRNSRSRDPGLQEVLPDLCDKITRVDGGLQLNMLAHEKTLWLLHPDYDMDFGRYTVFKDLNQLLRTHDFTARSAIAAGESKDWLILSFILANSVLHLHHGPWLRSNLSSTSICFLASKDTEFDITEPFLTTYCSAPNGDSLGTFQSPHRHPDILSLGVLLLEIASGAPLVVEDGLNQGYVALQRFNTLKDAWRKNSQKPVPPGLPRAIKACLEPEHMEQRGLHKKNVEADTVSRYIFEEIVFPLGEAVSTAYDIRLETLFEDMNLKRTIISQVGKKANTERLDKSRGSSKNLGVGVGSNPAPLASTTLDSKGDIKSHKEEDHGESVDSSADEGGRLDGQPDKLSPQEATDKWFKKFQKLLSVFDMGRLPSDQRLKVAVLDTGLASSSLDLSQDDHDRIRGRASFIDNDPVADKDKVGHGTHIATTILRLTRNVDLFIAKVTNSDRVLQKDVAKVGDQAL